MFDQLPSEIFADILGQLPIKTLFQWTSLSKFYYGYIYGFITNPDFITTHMKRNNNKQLFLRYVPGCKKDKQKEKYFFEADDENFSGFHGDGLVLPVQADIGWFNVLGSINGVICLVNDAVYEGTDFFLWNPCIRKHIVVPKPHYVFSLYGAYESASGFGFDPVVNDYKIVRLVYFDGYFLSDNDDDGGENLAWRPVVEVYSLKSGCWKTCGSGPGCWVQKSLSCFLNGSVHWMGCGYVGHQNDNVIVKFDLSSESFGFIEFPSCLKNSFVNFIVQECRGMLTLINTELAYNHGSCCVWVMREYGMVDSWTKIIDFDSRNPDPSVIYFRNIGKAIVAWNSYYASEESSSAESAKPLMISFDPVKHEVTRFGMLELVQLKSIYMSTYVESMVLMQQGEAK